MTLRYDESPNKIIVDNWPLFVRFAKVIRDPKERQDFAQELALDFLENFAKWKREYALSTFIAYRLREVLRKWGYFKRYDTRKTNEWYKHEAVLANRDDWKEPDSDKLKKALSILLPKEKMLIVEVILNGRKLRHLAIEDGCSFQNYSQMFIRAKAKLARYLREVENAYD